jgi:hypothetical protein
VTLTAAQRGALMNLALEVGDQSAARQLEVSLGTLARAVAGQRVLRATRTHLLVRLDAPRPELGIVRLDFQARK